MGTSKKHKHDRDHKKKKKHRSRSKSRDRDYDKDGRYSRDQEGDGRSRRKRRREEDDFEDQDLLEEFSHAGKRNRRPEPARDYGEDGELFEENQGGASASAGGGGESLSIDETNRLRAKLGLKPLDMPGSKQPGTSDTQATATDKPDVHVPAQNISRLKKEAAIREKLAAAKEKRKIHTKLSQVKTLGESDSEDEAATLWVQKNRTLQLQKEMAAKRAAALEEMDQEFGLGELINEEFGKNKHVQYSSKDLRGLRVEHSEEAFKEGRVTVLTLQDQGVLDDADDVLVNVNIIDDEKAAKNVEKKMTKAEYQAYKDEEIDQYGMLKPKDVLSKYDEEISGPQKKSFQLDGRGSYNTEYEKQMREMKAQYETRAEGLSMPALRVASEFYTSEEMEKFKTVKKKVRKIRKKSKVKVVTADDLVPEGESGGTADLGSRALGRPIKKEPLDSIPGLDLQGAGGAEDMDLDPADLVITNDIEGPDVDLTGVKVDDDEGGLELELALNKARRLRLYKPKALPVLTEQIQVKEEVDNDDYDDRMPTFKSISLNQTSEFCRSLGEIPTYGQAGNRMEDEEELMDFERELQEERLRQAAASPHEDSGWQEVEIDTRPVEFENKEEKHVLDDEPTLGTGVGAALELAKKKGYLEKETVKIAAPKSKTIQATNYAIDDKRNDDLDDKMRKTTRYVGAVSDFCEKEGYKPDVRINYVDDMGRPMDQKESFRFLSHRFHGKGSGKIKTEKRNKKQQLEQLVNSMGSTDTPLRTASMLEDKLQKQKTPYLVLSGSGKTQQTLMK